MPKVVGTRKLKAAELLRTAENGPSFDMTFFYSNDVKLSLNQKKEIEDYFKDKYRLWSSTWIIPQMKVLIPELKEIKNV